jgi:dihydropteroate synthase
MHMQGAPRTMQHDPHYLDVVREVRDFLQARASACELAGIARERIVVDPGIGFGKTVAQNFALLARQGELLRAGNALLAGWSRKSSLGHVTGMDVGDRMVPSVAAALLAVERGARVVRVHDVRETVAALKVWRAVQQD